MSGGPFVALYGGKTVEVNIASASARSAKTRIAGPFPRSAETEALVQLLANAPELLKTIDIVADGLSADARTMDGMTKEAAVAKLRAAYAKATGQQGGSND